METTKNSNPARPRDAKGGQVIGGLLISLFTIVLILGALELTGYLWEKKTAQGPLGWTLVASRRLEMQKLGSTSQPYYLLKPNTDALWRNIPVHIGSHGLRTDEFSLPKPADRYRILNLGDSIVFGWEVRQEETYGKRLEKLFQPTGGQQVEVINAGVPGWNPEQEYNYLQQEGLSYQPDLVVLDLTLVNDIYGGGPEVNENQTFFSFLRDHTYAWPFLTTEMRFLMARRMGPEAIPVLNPPKNADAYFPLSESDPAWDAIWKYISAMQQISKQRNIPLVVVMFPTAYQLNSLNHPDTPQRVLSSRMQAAGIPYVDLLPTYRQACAQAAKDACEGYENLLFADVWMHPNALGHQLAAQELQKLLNR